MARRGEDPETTAATSRASDSYPARVDSSIEVAAEADPPKRAVEPGRDPLRKSSSRLEPSECLAPFLATADISSFESESAHRAWDTAVLRLKR